MFPSNPNSSNDHVFPPLDSFSNHENYDVHFNYLQMNYNNNTPEVPSSQIMHNIVTTINQDFVMQQQKFSERSGLRYCEDGSHDDLLDSVISSDTKETATAKKDGSCRKINTARGPRDRRVRFSTEIARKFFGLQDLLGFDRASKTLDWLLTNSVTAIKELVEETKHDSSDRSNLKFLETIVGGSDEKKSVVKCVDGKKTKSRRKCEGGSFRANNAARDRLRAEARARARERTREKMRVKKVDDELVLDSKLTLKKSGGFWSEIEVESDCKNLGCECIMDQETMLKESEDSSYLYASLYENLEQYFMNIR